MKNITTLLTLLTTLTTITTTPNHNHPPTYLTQKNFKSGSYIIKKPGKYILKENIIFNPPQKIPLHLLRTNPAFHLGFFAAIIIQSENVILNLNNFSIIQSEQHYLHQRFYSHIELGSAPFVPKTGPHDFSSDFVVAKNVVIENGVLGLSSHHGVHGNNCERIKIRNLKIHNFEVGGVAINGGRFIDVENVVVGPTSEKVAFNGLFSTGKQIEGYVEALVEGGEICTGFLDDETFVRIRGIDLTAGEILDDLRNLILETEEAFLSGNYNDIPDLLRNESNLPDGSALYGFVFHTEKPAVGGFNKNYEDNYKSSHISLKNIVIKELNHKVIERISLQKEDETKLNNFTGGQIDPRGSFFNILDYTNKNGSYKSNPIGNAQLLVSKYKKCLLNNTEKFREKRLYHTNTKRDSISKRVISWASKKNKNLKANYICNSDQMLHSIKGTIPIRLSGISKINLKNIKIEKIKNKTNFGSKICGNYRSTISFSNNKPGFLGCDLRGILFESCSNAKIENININNLFSKNGKVFGLEAMFKNTNIRGDVSVHNLQVKKWEDLPIDFYKIPQGVPSASPVLVDFEAEVFLVVNSLKKKIKENNKISGYKKIREIRDKEDFDGFEGVEDCDDDFKFRKHDLHDNHGYSDRDW